MTLYGVNRNTGEAVYLQITRILEQEIKSSYDAGDYLSTENELAGRFSVNRHTIRHAIDELVSAGVVERQHGRGTVVLGAALNYRVGEHTRFTETLESLGKTTDTSIIRKIIVPARGGVARRLNIDNETPVLMLETLRKVDDRPFCVISHFIPVNAYPEIETDYLGGSLHAFFKQKLNISLLRKESLATASIPIGDDASYLQIPQSFPVLRVKSINIDAVSKHPIEYSITRFRADRVQLSFTP
ncbi:MAG: phosphonate metabolism transcriptional regulator PhnF [Gammaproteobacteria bacterium]|nr:phosphonate metabolism transcriptional regulator PhnF [Gammaproteobacteria bacterium]